jgi:hypothetical protein
MVMKWLPSARDYCREWGVSEDVVNAALAFPQSVHDDVTNQGHAAKVYRRGDIEVAVGMAFEEPAILHVRVITGSSGRSSRGGPVSSGSAPTTVRGMKKYAVEAGLKIRAGTRHDQVIDPVTGSVITTIPSTPSDVRSLLNTYADIRRWERQAGAA